MTLRYLDVCSGYSAFSVGATGLDVECVGYAEVDAFPAALLGYHYGASRARYMPDPDAPDLPAKERKSRLALRKAMASLPDSQFGNRVTNFGDFTQIREDDVRGPVHLLTGGTPCQAFSVAGKREGLDDPRGNLTLEFLALARRIRAEWLVWENVPGILSHDGGRTMGTFLRLLGQCGYGWAYRVLDAQYIRVDGHERAVPQRRRRVILVAHLGDAAGPAAVLFERESLRGDPAPRRETGEGVADPSAPGTDRCGFGGGNRSGAIDAAACLTARGHKCDFEVETFIAQPTAATLTRGSESRGKGGYAGRRQEDDTNLVAHALRAEGFDASEDGTGRGTPIVPVYAINSDALDRSGEGAAGTAGERAGLGVQEDVAYSMRAKRPDAVAFAIQERAVSENINAGPQGKGYQPDVSYTLEARHHVQAVAFSMRGRDGDPQAEPAPDGLAPSLRTMGGGSSHAFVATGWAVRRLTPRECERLMGVPDVRKSAKIEIWNWSEQATKHAPVVRSNHKLLNSALRAAESGSSLNVENAVAPSTTHRPDRELVAVLNVSADCERGEVLIRSEVKESNTNAVNVVVSPSVNLAVQSAPIARLVALTMLIAAKRTPDGKAASPVGTTNFIPLWNGDSIARLSGQEIAEHAVDVATAIAMVSHHSMSTTYEHGRNTKPDGLILTTLCCSVVHAIASCIPSETLAESSFTLNLESIECFTAITYRGKPAADGPRYKALGNSQGANKMRWIARGLLDVIAAQS